MNHQCVPAAKVANGFLGCQRVEGVDPSPLFSTGRKHLECWASSTGETWTYWSKSNKWPLRIEASNIGETELAQFSPEKGRLRLGAAGEGNLINNHMRLIRWSKGDRA